MRILILGGLLLALAGCGKSEAEVLEENYEKWVEDRASEPTQCKESQAVAAAWARQGDQEKYDSWKLRADLNCLHADAVAGIR